MRGMHWYLGAACLLAGCSSDRTTRTAGQIEALLEGFPLKFGNMGKISGGTVLGMDGHGGLYVQMAGEGETLKRLPPGGGKATPLCPMPGGQDLYCSVFPSPFNDLMLSQEEECLVLRDGAGTLLHRPPCALLRDYQFGQGDAPYHATLAPDARRALIHRGGTWVWYSLEDGTIETVAHGLEQSAADVESGRLWFAEPGEGGQVCVQQKPLSREPPRSLGCWALGPTIKARFNGTHAIFAGKDGAVAIRATTSEAVVLKDPPIKLGQIVGAWPGHVAFEGEIPKPARDGEDQGLLVWSVGGGMALRPLFERIEAFQVFDGGRQAILIDARGATLGPWEANVQVPPPTATPIPSFNIAGSPKPTVECPDLRGFTRRNCRYYSPGVGTLVYVPGGRYVVGPPGPEAKVVELQPFLIGETEVTVSALQPFLNQMCPGYDCRLVTRYAPGSGQPWQREGNGWAPGTSSLAPLPSHPATFITSGGARAYCASLGMRLPRADEWEAAARGPDGRAFPWGNTEATCQVAQMRQGDQLNCGMDRLALVGTKPAGASPFGAMDMAGNAAEWVGEGKTAMGGWYGSDSKGLVAWSRWAEKDGLGEANVGFRCVRTVMPTDLGAGEAPPVPSEQPDRPLAEVPSPPEPKETDLQAAEAAFRQHIRTYNEGTVDRFVEGFTMQMECWFDKPMDRDKLRRFYDKHHFAKGRPHENSITRMSARQEGDRIRLDYEQSVRDKLEGTVDTGKRVVIMRQTPMGWKVAAWSNPEARKACLR